LRLGSPGTRSLLFYFFADEGPFFPPSFSESAAGNRAASPIFFFLSPREGFSFPSFFFFFAQYGTKVGCFLQLGKGGGWGSALPLLSLFLSL